MAAICPRLETFDPAAAFICYTNPMFLQTLVQLNILILATPALAGWTLMPSAQPGVVRAVSAVWQGRTVEAVAPKAEPSETAQTRRAVRPQPLVLPRMVIPSAAKPAEQTPAFSDALAVALVSFHSFPHATRAP
jgi:hypothetical protein